MKGRSFLMCLIEGCSFIDISPEEMRYLIQIANLVWVSPFYLIYKWVCARSIIIAYSFRNV